MKTLLALAVVVLIAVPVFAADPPAPLAPTSGPTMGGRLVTPTAGVAQGQTIVVNPVIVEFQPSPDHDVLQLDGTPVLDHYVLNIYRQDTGALVSTAGLGKPAPTNGLITVSGASIFNGTPPNVVCVGKVAAVGIGGSSESAASNPFGIQGAASAPRAVPGAPVVKK